MGVSSTHDLGLSSPIEVELLICQHDPLKEAKGGFSLSLSLLPRVVRDQTAGSIYLMAEWMTMTSVYLVVYP